jgi:hypothetical protein
MDATTRNLIWREVRERRTQAAACLLWMLGGMVYCIVRELPKTAEDSIGNFFLTTMLYMVSAPIFLAMRTSLGEMTDRTRSFSDGLPISPRRRGWIRLAGGAAALVVPILVSAFLMSVSLKASGLEQRPDMPRWQASFSLWYFVATCVWSAMNLYLIVCLLGTRLRSEVHLGYCGTLVSCLGFVGMVVVRMLKSQGHSEIGLWLAAIVPIGIVGNSFNGSPLYREAASPLLINTLVQVGLAMLFVRRYGQGLSGGAAPRRRKAEYPASAERCVGWRLKLPTRGAAVTWLAWRQALPMCLPGLAVACLMTMFAPESHESTLRHFADSLPAAMAIIGILWAVVVGAGIFSSEIDWRMGEFWRTRPISARRLFGVKFVAGLLAVLVVLDGTVIAIGWNSPRWGDYDSMNWSYIACIVPLHAVMFTLAVAWTCVLRRAALGGLAALASLFIIEIALSWSTATRGLSPFGLYVQVSNVSRVQRYLVLPDGYPALAAIWAIAIVAAVLVAGWALGRYDPRRQTG